jgi:probable F420-dependent oxidoreductase
MDLSNIGVFAFLDGLSGKQTGDPARKVERLGYRVLWIPEGAGRDPFAHSGYLLSQTERLVVASGIANVFMREPGTTIRAARTLGELFEDRFILGLGVSGKTANEVRGLRWDKPVSFMRDYLARMKATGYMAPGPKTEPPVVLAGILPKMVELAAAETNGTHTYFVPPEHTARLRLAIGPNKWICAEQAVMLETDPKRAREAARKYMSFYLRLPGSSYAKNLRTFGFGDIDFAGDFSDRLVDAVVAWGSVDELRARIDAHRKAGATHVCVLPLRADGVLTPDESALQALAPGK